MQIKNPNQPLLPSRNLSARRDSGSSGAGRGWSRAKPGSATPSLGQPGPSYPCQSQDNKDFWITVTISKTPSAIPKVFSKLFAIKWTLPAYLSSPPHPNTQFPFIKPGTQNGISEQGPKGWEKRMVQFQTQPPQTHVLPPTYQPKTQKQQKAEAKLFQGPMLPVPADVHRQQIMHCTQNANLTDPTDL